MKDLHLLRQVAYAATFLMLCGAAQAQVLTCAEIQGGSDVSPYEGQEVTVTGKVTVFFGDIWYLQDDYGPWNGLMCVGPDVLIDANPPWWNAPRQPEVGDVLQLTGTIYETDGNTQMMDITEFVFNDFWNATAAGVGVTVAEMMDESLEGTRARLDPVTVMTAPEDGVWTVSDATGTLKVYGVDTDDPGLNEDADGPTPGDVYRIYGAVRQIGEEYVLDLSDIDTLSLAVGVGERKGLEVLLMPNPARDAVRISGLDQPGVWDVYDAMGRTVRTGQTSGAFTLSLEGLLPGRYTVQLSVDGESIRKPLVVH
ncbi:MAG: T9SS type A sorting domain-containing protein [Flavobacteriales bacterium]|nr:T9SS type A sorting domain-containing protein [Flavobacteriales bacterium]